MEEYLEFAEYGGATILPEQIPAEDWKRFYVIGVRDAGQFKAAHIPVLQGGLVEWKAKGGFDAYRRATQTPKH